MPERMGQQLQQSLKYRFQTDPNQAKYELKITLSSQEAPLQLNDQARSCLISYAITVSYQLINLADRKVIKQKNTVIRNYKSISHSYYSCTTEDMAVQNENVARITDYLAQEMAYIFSKNIN